MARRWICGSALMTLLALLIGCSSAPSPPTTPAATSGGGFKGSNKQSHTAVDAGPKNLPPPPPR